MSPQNKRKLEHVLCFHHTAWAGASSAGQCSLTSAASIIFQSALKTAERLGAAMSRHQVHISGVTCREIQNPATTCNDWEMRIDDAPCEQHVYNIYIYTVLYSVCRGRPCFSTSALTTGRRRRWSLILLLPRRAGPKTREIRNACGKLSFTALWACWDDVTAVEEQADKKALCPLLTHHPNRNEPNVSSWKCAQGPLLTQLAITQTRLATFRHLGWVNESVELQTSMFNPHIQTCCACFQCL